MSENRRHRAGGVAARQRAAAAVCCVAATALAPLAAAQTAVFPDGARVLGGPREAQGPPNAAATLGTFGAVEAFVRGRTEKVAVEGLPRVQGCAVVLRLSGEVVGKGQSMGVPGEGPDAGRIALAAEEAWGQVERLVRAKAPRSGMDRVRREVMISLELAGPSVRINANAYNDFDGTLSAGLDGLLATMEGKVGAVFPGAAAAGSVLPSEAARRSVSLAAAEVRGEAGGASLVALTEPAELEKKHGVTLYRFRTTHVAQWRADLPPELLYRGQRLVLQEDVDETPELWHMADRLAGNLINRLTLAPAGGTLNLLSVQGGDADAYGAALARRALIAYITRREGPLKEPAVSAAQRYLALSRQRAERATDVERLAADAVIAHDPDRPGAPEFAWIDGYLKGGKDEAPPGLRGLVVWGLGGERPGESESAVRKLMAQTGVAALPSEMPWLGWADLAADVAQGRAPGQKSAPALREMRSVVWKHQLQAVDAGPDRQDMVGGIVVPGSRTLLPTWQTARLAAFLATMAGEPELTTAQERTGEVVRLLSTARYLRQLQVDDALGWMCADATIAKGGLRNATWDQRSQTDATAVALLAVLEVIRGVERALGRAEEGGVPRAAPAR